MRLGRFMIGCYISVFIRYVLSESLFESSYGCEMQILCKHFCSCEYIVPGKYIYTYMCLLSVFFS